MIRAYTPEEFRALLRAFLIQERTRRRWTTRKASEMLGMDWRSYCRVEDGVVTANEGTLQKMKRLYGSVPSRLCVCDAAPINEGRKGDS